MSTIKGYEYSGVYTPLDATHGIPVNVVAGGGGSGGDASAANQTTEIAKLTSIDGKVTACNTGAVVLAAGSAVVGHVIVDTAPTTTVTGTVGVTGTFWQATQPVSIASLPALAAGSAVIGHVIVDTAPTTAVTIASLPALAAGTATVGVAIAPAQTGAVYSGTTALTPKFATISASSSGATTVVAAVTSKKIRVLKFTLSASAAVNVKFQSHVTPTDLTGLFYLAANGGVGGSYCPVGHFETVSGEALDVNLSGAIPVGGVLTYIEV